MSGGWERTFTLAAPTDVALSFWYNLSQVDSESDELSQVLLSVDGTLVGQPPNDYVDQVAGGGTRSELSRTSPAFSPKMARSSFSSGDSCVSPLGVIFPTTMSRRDSTRHSCSATAVRGM